MLEKIQKKDIKRKPELKSIKSMENLFEVFFLTCSIHIFLSLVMTFLNYGLKCHRSFKVIKVL